MRGGSEGKSVREEPCLAPDEARDLRAAHGDVEVVDGNQAAEVDAKVLGLQDGDGAQIALGDELVWTGVRLSAPPPRVRSLPSG